MTAVGHWQLRCSREGWPEIRISSSQVEVVWQRKERLLCVCISNEMKHRIGQICAGRAIQCEILLQKT